MWNMSVRSDEGKLVVHFFIYIVDILYYTMFSLYPLYIVTYHLYIYIYSRLQNMAWSDSDAGSFMTLCDNRDCSDTEFSGWFC